jgi:hypothetical protein
MCLFIEYPVIKTSCPCCCTVALYDVGGASVYLADEFEWPIGCSKRSSGVGYPEFPSFCHALKESLIHQGEEPWPFMAVRPLAKFVVKYTFIVMETLSEGSSPDCPI